MSRANDYISAAVRRKVAERAGFRCEYCLLDEKFMGHSAQIDHIISLKHRGTNDIENLAYSCWLCNGNKGSDVGSVKYGTHEFIRFFNPRIDIWSEHFRLIVYRIEPISDIGLVTEFIFGFNESERVAERSLLF